jgi:hypothetical protein
MKMKKPSWLKANVNWTTYTTVRHKVPSSVQRPNGLRKVEKTQASNSISSIYVNDTI